MEFHQVKIFLRSWLKLLPKIVSDWQPDFPKEDYVEPEIGGSLAESLLCPSTEMWQYFFHDLYGLDKVI